MGRQRGKNPLGSIRLPFRTRLEVDRYFSGKTIKCLLCGRRFGRLSLHLAAKHELTTDQYKAQFGLPWTRGLSSAASHANSGWSRKRKKEAARLARKTRFFKFARQRSRRQVAPFLQTETSEHLGAYASGFGKRFESRVRALFRRGLIDKEIANVLGVNRMTVNRRTKHWRKPTPKRRRRLAHLAAPM
jgi:hypothetical protein